MLTHGQWSEDPNVRLSRAKKEIVMKIVGVFALLIGLLMIGFAGLAYLELHAAASGEVPPNPETMPLTKIVGPELFDPEHASSHPSDLAGIAFKRIYIVGGASFGAFTLGVCLLLARRDPKAS